MLAVVESTFNGWLSLTRRHVASSLLNPFLKLCCDPNQPTNPHSHCEAFNTTVSCVRAEVW